MMRLDKENRAKETDLQDISDFSKKEIADSQSETLEEKYYLIKKQSRQLRKEKSKLNFRLEKARFQIRSLRRKLALGKKKNRDLRKRFSNNNMEFLMKFISNCLGEEKAIKLLKSEENLFNVLEKSVSFANKILKKREERLCCYGHPKLMIVDGHNLIFRNECSGNEEKNAKLLQERSLRRELITEVFFASEKLNSKIEIYFDTGHKVQDKEKFGNLTVFYCPAGRGGADEQINQRIGGVKRGENVLVFTSDRKHIAKQKKCDKYLSKGVRFLSSETFADYLLALRQYREKISQISYLRRIEI